MEAGYDTKSTPHFERERIVVANSSYIYRVLVHLPPQIQFIRSSSDPRSFVSIPQSLLNSGFDEVDSASQPAITSNDIRSEEHTLIVTYPTSNTFILSLSSSRSPLMRIVLVGSRINIEASVQLWAPGWHRGIFTWLWGLLSMNASPIYSNSTARSASFTFICCKLAGGRKSRVRPTLELENLLYLHWPS